PRPRTHRAGRLPTGSPARPRNAPARSLSRRGSPSRRSRTSSRRFALRAPAGGAASARRNRFAVARSVAAEPQPRTAHQRARAVETLERPGIRPPTVEHLVRQGAPFDVAVVDVCDLQLAARARLERLDDVEDPGVVHVDARDRVARGRVLRLLDDADAAVAGQLRHAEPFRVVHLLEQDLCTLALVPEAADRLGERVLEEIVAQDHDDRLAIGEVLGQAQRLRDPALAFLVRVVQVLEAELTPVAERSEALDRVVAARHDQDVRHAIDEGLVQAPRVSEPALAFLVGVAQVIEAELTAGAEKSEEFALVLAALPDQDVLDPRLD